MTARLIAIAALAAALTGCIDKLLPVEFVGTCAWPDTAACQPPAGKCDRYQNGQLALFYQQAPELIMVAELQNQRPNNADSIPGQVNGANAIITAYSFKFSGSPAIALSRRRVPYLSTPISARGSSTVIIPVLPSGTVAELRATAGYEGLIEAEVTAHGEFGDGSSFEVGPITFPVLVFTGAPGPVGCPDPTKTPVFCPNEFQTNGVDCATGTGTTTFTLGGTITGLTAAGLVLATPGLPTLAVPANSTSFAFPTRLPDGTSYNVTVQTQPAGLTCTVNRGSGAIAGANVTSVSISCN